MLTSVELDYLKLLIMRYRNKGYYNYLCHTVSDNNSSDYDLCVYFSKEKIIADSDNQFEVKNRNKNKYR